MKTLDKYCFMPGNGDGDDDGKTEEKTADWWKLFF